MGFDEPLCFDPGFQLCAVHVRQMRAELFDYFDFRMRQCRHNFSVSVHVEESVKILILFGIFTMHIKNANSVCLRCPTGLR